MGKRFSPYYAGILIWLVLVVASLSVLLWQIDAPWFLLLLAATNIGTFFLYGFDKFSAAQKITRIPEYVLYFTAFAGGAAGALAAMQLFRHKTSKVSFQFVLALIILLEVAIAVAILRPSLFEQVFQL